MSLTPACDLILSHRIAEASQQRVTSAELRAFANAVEVAGLAEAAVRLLAACEPHMATCAELRAAVNGAVNELPRAYRDAFADWQRSRAELREALRESE